MKRLLTNHFLIKKQYDYDKKEKLAEPQSGDGILNTAPVEI
jgi:hypothetical protein